MGAARGPAAPGEAQLAVAPAGNAVLAFAEERGGRPRVWLSSRSRRSLAEGGVGDVAGMHVGQLADLSVVEGPAPRTAPRRAGPDTTSSSTAAATRSRPLP